ncbi:glutamine amidotransferase class-I [Thermodesulfobium narugense DSM 14796]|uniref:Glutamine amidotransferase class-I n=1 Tax=Thermodesulfobium narugense DSM 14796 TaxID=747365 RepID=M1E7M8_9BACT|nr:type 1 glutamine amidotransferase [Thermodesulfobium narugense]AEE14545.1 glutamine amidotransferase class-I [Thermodesulfobium narugense DSM 14796]
MRILAIRHVKEEGLGYLYNIFSEKGFGIGTNVIDICDITKNNTSKIDLDEYNFLIILGGYMGVYEYDKYPFLKDEFKIVESALNKDLPIIGICLGSQILAHVLGARVYKGEKGKEIGWYEMYKQYDHKFIHNFPTKFKAFCWHGDTFDLPKDSLHIFSSEKYQNQGFIYKNSIGLQFHIEVDTNMILKWANLYSDEIANEKIDKNSLIPEVEDIKKIQSYLTSLIDNML